MRPVTVVNYGAGNLQSVSRRLEFLDAKVVVTSDASEIAKAEKLVLPGVGHFGNAMDNLHARGLVNALNEAVVAKGAPILGICLGMQLMASVSAEGDARGLGWFKGSVKRFEVADKLRFKVPHMGWNHVRQAKGSALMEGIPDGSEFYFVHSYHYVPAAGPEVLLTADYSGAFTCAVERDNIYGVQFHPEKSHEVGLRLLRNFLAV